MKRRWGILLGLAVLAVMGVFLLFGTRNHAQRELAATRRALRQQGFKVDLREFDLSLSRELSARAAKLGTTTRAALTNRARPMLPRPLQLELLKPAGPDAAVVAWQLDPLKDNSPSDHWQPLDENPQASRARLEAARAAALAGPIRFEPIGSRLPSALLPYLADLRTLEALLGEQTILALHAGNKAEAWTNLLAATCLVTAYEPEPIEVSHMVRFGCAISAYNTTWNALQMREWMEAQLAALQRRWEAPDFWRGLPDTAAYARADMAALCQLERQHRFSPDMPLAAMMRYPKQAWDEFRSNLQQFTSRGTGSYENETALLLYYRDREVERRKAVQAATWAEMRRLPGATNLVPFRTPTASRIQAMMNLRQMALARQGGGPGLLGRAAETEARRRLLVTAIALERYRGRQGSYPETLSALVPEWLKSPPIDFMDGQPLRYRRTEDGHFVLYSVGLDCVDNGGKLRQPRLPEMAYEPPEEYGSREGTDLVWPRPASKAEVASLEQKEQEAEQARATALEGFAATAWWGHTARRQAKVETILAAPPTALTNDPVYRGAPLSEVLQKGAGTNKLTLAHLLALRPVSTGAEPEVATFELPIQYAVLTNLGSLNLYIDPIEDEDSDEGCQVGHCECLPGPNGNCRLVWDTIYESPGKHALQVGLDLHAPTAPEQGLLGPLMPFVVSNLCQFSPSSMFFNPESGGTFRAKLPEANATYTIAITSPAGEPLRHLSGSTSNGLLEVFWDLKDDQGQACTNESFGSVFHLQFPDSGRAQTLKGP